MAKALVLGSLQTRFLGQQTSLTGGARALSFDIANRVLTAAWLSIADVEMRPLYGMIMARLEPATLNDGIFLKEGWFGSGVSASTDGTLVEGIAWYGELPLFDKRGVRLIFGVRNFTGATVTYTGGYTWKEFEENDRPT